jgi:plasmid replication initiation protein
MENPNKQVVPFNIKNDNYQPNLITESRQEFSENEKKIVSIIINQLRKDVIENWTGHNLEFLIPTSELTHNNHSFIKKTVNSLAGKKIIQDYSDTVTEGIIYRAIVPFPIVQYEKINKNTYIRVCMLANVVPQFIELGKYYTKYNLEVILSMTSIYSQRMYEIIMLHVGRKQRSFEYSMEKIKFMFNCPDSYTFAEIRRRVLEPAQKDLEEKAGLIFSFEPTKKELKKVLAIGFNVKSRVEIALDAVEQEAAQVRNADPLEVRDYTTRLLNNYKFTRTQQDAIMTDPNKWTKFMQLDSEIYNGVRTGIDDPTAYIAKSLGFDKKSNTTPKGKIK